LPGTERGYGVLARKEGSDLLVKVNEAIEVWKNDPAVKARWKEYFVD
jgi:hypothetical protein